MTRWCFLVAFSVITAFGQSSQNAVDPTRITKEAVQAILGNNLGQTKAVPRVNSLAPLVANVPAQCSVPLVEMEIPKGNSFVITQVPPPGDFRDNMPMAHGLPACPTGR
jgi:hypothetical protein